MAVSEGYNLAMLLYKQEYAYATEWLEGALEKLDNVQYENIFTSSKYTVITYVYCLKAA